MKLLKDLGTNECKFPGARNADLVGHFYFCAAPTEPNQSYCRGHQRLCVTAATPRGVKKPKEYPIVTAAE